jgi:hypothetical protein
MGNVNVGVSQHHLLASRLMTDPTASHEMIFGLGQASTVVE